MSDFKLLLERSRWVWKRHWRQFTDNSKRELTSTDGKDYREFLEEHLPKGESPWQFWNTDSFAYLDISRKFARYFRKICKDKNWSQEKEGWKQALGRLPGVRHSETKMSSTNLDVWQCEWLFSSSSQSLFHFQVPQWEDGALSAECLRTLELQDCGNVLFVNWCSKDVSFWGFL